MNDQCELLQSQPWIEIETEGSRRPLYHYSIRHDLHDRRSARHTTNWTSREKVRKYFKAKLDFQLALRSIHPSRHCPVVDESVETVFRDRTRADLRTPSLDRCDAVQLADILSRRENTKPYAE